MSRMKITGVDIQKNGISSKTVITKKDFKQFSVEQFGNCRRYKWSNSKKRNVLFDDNISEEFRAQYLGEPWEEPESTMKPYQTAYLKAVQCGKTELTAQQAAYLYFSKKRKFSLKRLFKRWFKKWN